MNHYLIIGLGKIGLEVANTLARQGEVVIGVSRSAKPSLSAAVSHIRADARYLRKVDLGTYAAQISHICIIVSPDNSSEQGYQDSYFAISEHIATLAQQLPKLQRLVFISSTSVYGQQQGEIIDLKTPIQAPTMSTAKVLLETEDLLQKRFDNRVTIIRPSGIYGMEWLRLLTMAKKIALGEQPVSENTWTNRIFDTDLVNVIVGVLQDISPLPLYLATDFEPAPLYEVLGFLTQQQRLTLALPDMQPTTGKRLISNLPKQALRYPNWRVGYQAILAAANEQST